MNVDVPATSDPVTVVESPLVDNEINVSWNSLNSRGSPIDTLEILVLGSDGNFHPVTCIRSSAVPIQDVTQCTIKSSLIFLQPPFNLVGGNSLVVSIRTRNSRGFSGYSENNDQESAPVILTPPAVQAGIFYNPRTSNWKRMKL